MILGPKDSDGPLSPAADSDAELYSLRLEVAGLVARGMDVDEAAALVGLDVAEYRPTARRPWMPLPDEIAAQCRAIRESWTPTERRSRWARPGARRWSPQTIAERDIIIAA